MSRMTLAAFSVIMHLAAIFLENLILYPNRFRLDLSESDRLNLSKTNLKLKMLIEGEASGPLIFSREALSFWGGVDAHSGEVIDRRHPLSGQILAGKVLVLPGSRGSSSGSGVLLEAIRNRTAPAAIITAEPDHILALAALLAQELYGRTSPVAVADPAFFEWAASRAGTLCYLKTDGTFNNEEFTSNS